MIIYYNYVITYIYIMIVYVCIYEPQMGSNAIFSGWFLERTLDISRNEPTQCMRCASFLAGFRLLMGHFPSPTSRTEQNTCMGHNSSIHVDCPLVRLWDHSHIPQHSSTKHHKAQYIQNWFGKYR